MSTAVTVTDQRQTGHRPGGNSNSLAIDSQDRVYYVDQPSNHVVRVNQDGTVLSPFFTTTDEITGIGFDPSGTTLYVVSRGAPSFQGTYFNYKSGRFRSVAPNGSVTLLLEFSANVGPFSDLGGIEVKPPFLYVGAYRRDTSEEVLQINMTTWSVAGSVLVFPLGPRIIFDVKLDSLGNLYTIFTPPGGVPTTAGGPPTIYKNATVTYSVGNFPTSLAIDCLDRVFFTDRGSNQLRQLTGTNTSDLINGSFPSPDGVDLDSRGKIFIGTPSYVAHAGGDSSCTNDFAVTFLSLPSKIFADYNPSTGQETTNSQLIVLTACLFDQTIPRAPTDLVYWIYDDMDDPSNDPTVDPPGAVPDNLGDFDDSAPFTPQTGFPLTVGGPGAHQYGTAYGLVSGIVCSKVQFHPTDAPGDNFRITATLQTQLGERSVKSPILTVWKRVHVELDSMGEVEGPVDSDDAVIGDVPDPLGEFLASAFAPAYIEVMNDGPGARSNVAFDHYVPNELLDRGVTDVQQVKDQGTLARDSISSTGAWNVYGQGGYECFRDADNDPPDGDLPWVGITNRRLGRYSFVFSEVIRDVSENSPVLDEGYLLRALLLHEFGHQFGLDHETTVNGSGGIMEQQSNFGYPYFNPKQLRALRCIGQGSRCPEQAVFWSFPGALE